MVRLTPPYFFPEFLKPQGKASPTARERTLGLTAKDLDWLYNLYLATDESRLGRTQAGTITPCALKRS